jgi:hypothetical protein
MAHLLIAIGLTVFCVGCSHGPALPNGEKQLADSGQAPRVQTSPADDKEQAAGPAGAQPLALAAGDRPLTEKDKITALIANVQSLKDARFVRNGREYNSAQAAEFLRRKWQASAASIATARDFIEKIASISSTSGQPYTLRFKDGTEKNSGDYLLSVLKKLEKAAEKPGA